MMTRSDKKWAKILNSWTHKDGALREAGEKVGKYQWGAETKSSTAFRHFAWNAVERKKK